jgi:hypothetical protein
LDVSPIFEVVFVQWAPCIMRPPLSAPSFSLVDFTKIYGTVSYSS